MSRFSRARRAAVSASASSRWRPARASFKARRWAKNAKTVPATNTAHVIRMTVFIGKVFCAVPCLAGRLGPARILRTGSLLGRFGHVILAIFHYDGTIFRQLLHRAVAQADYIMNRAPGQNGGRVRLRSVRVQILIAETGGREGGPVRRGSSCLVRRTDQNFRCGQLVAHHQPAGRQHIIVVIRPDAGGEADLLEVVDASNSQGLFVRIADAGEKILILPAPRGSLGSRTELLVFSAQAGDLLHLS